MCKNRRQCARPNSQFRLRCTWSQCLLSIYFCTLTVCWVFKSHTFCVVGAAFSYFFYFSFHFFFLFCYNFWLHAVVELLIRFRCTRYAHYSLFTLKTLLTRRANVHTHAYASWHKSFSLYALYTWHSFTLFGWHSTAYLWFISIPFNFVAFLQVHAACTLYNVHVRAFSFVWFQTYDNTFDLFLCLIEVQHFSL